jgi:hypothetical protein
MLASVEALGVFTKDRYQQGESPCQRQLLSLQSQAVKRVYIPKGDGNTLATARKLEERVGPDEEIVDWRVVCVNSARVVRGRGGNIPIPIVI